jgi:NAD(P)H-dependent flavin oxidoreductase YrpB (nitropropane dioxygenase family)
VNHDAPVLIQGGMGVAVSSWMLARAVGALGHLGVVSGTALDVVLARRLQLGDPKGEVREALNEFPDRGVARDLLDRYFVPGGIPATSRFRSVPMFSARPRPQLQALAVASGFAEVFLAKAGHDGPIGINFLQKVQLPTPAILYGALLAGVDYVLVGAGVPREFPGLLDALVNHRPTELELPVHGAREGEAFTAAFDPGDVFWGAQSRPPLRRPRFVAIVASATLAASLSRHGGRIDGFIVENHRAGGHNAPPRGRLSIADDGEPVYGPRDEVDLARMREIGLPFWLAGETGYRGAIEDARRLGAQGVQVGTLFALCDESGLDPALRAEALRQARAGAARVKTDARASPTGFPFKVLQLPGTLSEPAVYEGRERRCDLGYLREPYRRDDGALGFRCPGEPVGAYLRKGGRLDETEGRACLCNGLLATVGLGQRRTSGVEPPIVTAGAGLREVALLLGVRESYSAADVVRYLTGNSTEPCLR